MFLPQPLPSAPAVVHSTQPLCNPVNLLHCIMYLSFRLLTNNCPGPTEMDHALRHAEHAFSSVLSIRSDIDAMDVVEREIRESPLTLAAWIARPYPERRLLNIASLPVLGTYNAEYNCMVWEVYQAHSDWRILYLVLLGKCGGALLCSW